MPGQNSSGKNGASVVSVPASTGIITSPAAYLALCFTSKSYLCKIRWVFSITTIASSTTIPRASSSENSTITFMVIPSAGINQKASSVASGTDRPTKNALLKPIKNMRINTTKMKPRITVFSRSCNCTRVFSEVSPVTLTFRPCGNFVSWYSSSIAYIWSVASIRFSPLRFTTFSVTTLFLSSWAKSCLSLKASFISAISFKKTVVPTNERTMIFSSSFGSLNSPVTRRLRRRSSTRTSPPLTFRF